MQMGKRIKVWFAEQKQMHQLAMIGYECVPSRAAVVARQRFEIEQLQRAIRADVGNNRQRLVESVISKLPIHSLPTKRACAKADTEDERRQERHDTRAPVCL